MQGVLHFLTMMHMYPKFHIAVDDSVSAEERQQRQTVRDKYIGRPNASAINQYQDPYVSISLSSLHLRSREL